MEKESIKSCPPLVLLTVEKLFLKTVNSVVGFNNTLKTFVVGGLAESLKELQDNINLARRAMKDPGKRIECIESAIISLDTLRSYLRIALEYGREHKGGGLTYTASTAIHELIMNIEKQLNSWKLGTEKYRNGSEGSAS